MPVGAQRQPISCPPHGQTSGLMTCFVDKPGNLLFSRARHGVDDGRSDLDSAPAPHMTVNHLPVSVTKG